MIYAAKAIMDCLFRLDFQGASALWDFYWHPDDWEEWKEDV